ncbi:MAG TPA: DUF1501 domain-containing protein [Fimbriimonadaceae bacterium]|nr:DUF1501 domain-containing protein [Fimbriimonadaceae bacterium]HRJ32589.1 DUF1501 domain-containing protein [Fimbriimonadaceae bacterium]
MSEGLSRREILKRGGIIGLGLMTPSWVSALAKNDLIALSKGGKPGNDKVLVVIQLSGGNDGLNTVVPYQNPRYYQLRPTLGIKAEDALKIDQGLGLHPALGGLHELYQKKQVAILQNVGYPQPNRSHFKSMDIWQSASPDQTLRYGWIGRHFDNEMLTGPLNPIVALGLSTETPRALTAKDASIPCFASLADIQSMVGDPDAERLLRQIQGSDAKSGTDTRLIQQANKTALDAMTQLKEKLSKFSPKQTYNNDPFGNGFKQIAQLVVASPVTRVIYFSAGGFDTHARQLDQHSRLLKGLGDGLKAFMEEMEAAGMADRVIVVVFSEFGRRSYENASAGTDHGAAAPMFLVGKSVKGGLYGPIPDLNDLNDGDLKFAIDFRQVYATALDQWMDGDSKVVLGRSFTPLDVLR